MSETENKINCAAGERSGETVNEKAEPEISGDVDLSVLFDFEAAQSADEPDLIVELIDLFLETVPPQLSAIKEFVLQADEVSLKRAVHNLKGSSANLGVVSMARLCEALERMDFTESLQTINVCVDGLEQAFRRVRAIFSAIRRDRLGIAE